MGKPHPVELRQRVVDHVAEGNTHRSTAARFKASIKFVNDYAPEHLEVLVKDPWSVLGALEHVGEILLGENTPITLGNYCLGVNAILPTGGFAKSFSAVSRTSHWRPERSGWR